MLDEIKGLIKSAQGFIDIAWAQYCERSESIIRAFEKEKKPLEWELEYLLDGLLDFCFEERFRALFEKVCGVAEKYYPQVVEDYKRYFVEMHGDALK